MRKIILPAVLIMFLACGNRIKPPVNNITLHSIATNDDYIIGFTFPSDYREGDSCNLIYVADGSIGLGEYVTGTKPEWKAAIPRECVIVTIGHIGNWEEKRRRDFIPSDVSGNKEENFGNADHFYSFIKNELKPVVDKKFPKGKNNYFIGHSFSGLFCLYAALKNDLMFQDYFAISPSVWANDRELMKIEEEFSKSHTDLFARIHIYAGGLEIFNKVLSSSKAFYSTLKGRKYPHTEISIEIISTANHFSVRKPAIDKIFALIGS